MHPAKIYLNTQKRKFPNVRLADFSQRQAAYLEEKKFLEKCNFLSVCVEAPTNRANLFANKYFASVCQSSQLAKLPGQKIAFEHQMTHMQQHSTLHTSSQVPGAGVPAISKCKPAPTTGTLFFYHFQTPFHLLEQTTFLYLIF